MTPAKGDNVVLIASPNLPPGRTLRLREVHLAVGGIPRSDEAEMKASGKGATSRASCSVTATVR